MNTETAQQIEILLSALEQLQTQYELQFKSLNKRLDRIENPVEQTISSEKFIEIKGRNELIFSTMTQEQQSSACASCSHAKLSIQSEASSARSQSENLSFECLSGTNKEMVFACSKFTDE
ncbi:hypothetical protein [Vibrio parahaemolyticus]|uniref:hypothetical protein n=1 Tax=Vibrio parahaemolyticus TaxID=670 RepID=UPI0006A5912A|nr:hypothetical protein ACX13_24255 [Vibrio parahaemolyticus]